MLKNESGYIDKVECERRGFVRLERGKYYRYNTLERYAAQGVLDGGRYSSADRLSAGQRLYRDYYLSRVENVSANDVCKVRVDGCGDLNQSVVSLAAADRFRKAIKAIPAEFWPYVQQVCLNDEPLSTGEKGRKGLYGRYHAKNMLRLGLDRLIDYYLKR